MAAELKTLTVDASNGKYTFEISDSEAREKANTASSTAEAAKTAAEAAKAAAEGIKIPTALPNPKKLKFTGGATGEYDGSSEVTITIPAGGESGGSGDCNIQRIESLDDSNLVKLRDLDSGTYILYGYFNPYSGSEDSITIDNCIAAVVRMNAGSHIMVYNPRNFKIDCYEILENDGSFTYTRDSISMLDISTLLENGGGSIQYAKEIELLAANWQTEKEGRYYQTFDIPKANANSKMDVGLSEAALELMQDKVLTITATFRDGVTRVYAIGDKPTLDFTVQISFEDVVWL